MASGSARVRFHFWLILAAAAMATTVILLAAAIRQQNQQQSELSIVSMDATQALVFQLDREALRLMAAISAVQHSNDAADIDNLRLRYDIFLSRADLVQPNPSMALVEHRAEYQSVLRRLLAISEFGDAVFSEAALDTVKLEKLSELLSKNMPEFQALSVVTAVEIKHRLESQEEDLKIQGEWVVTLYCVQLLTLLGIVVTLFRQQRKQALEYKALFQLNQELKQAQVAADKAKQTQSEFLNTMSHELRTPLNGVKGMAQLLKRDKVSDADRVDFAQTIINSSNLLAVLLGDLLDLSQLDTNKLVLRPALCDVGHLLREQALLFTPAAEQKGLEISVEWQGPAGQLYRLDAVRLSQMLINLISNALKFTPAGFIRVKAFELERTGAEAILEFSVQDSGVGIPADKQDMLFKRFSQIENEAAHFSQGTGLGLSIVKALALRMGGGVGVESMLGQGARFWFQIQAVTTQATSAHIQPLITPALNMSAVLPLDHVNPANDAGPICFNEHDMSAQALAVDDNPINQKVMARFLNEIELPPLCVSNGLEAVQAIQQGMRPNFILMDVQMPVMNGLEATSQIRQWESAQGLPRTVIIGLTAGVADGDKGKCINSGMDDVLFKPVDLDELEEKIVAWTSH